MIKLNVDDLIGIRYRRNGRGPDGYDCYGLVIEVERRLGHTWEDIEEATKKGYDFNECLEKWKSQVKVREVDEPKELGDIVLIKDSHMLLTHVGVYLGNGQLIHCNRFGVNIVKIAQMKTLIGRVYRWIEE